MICERCWIDAGRQSLVEGTGSQTENYNRLLAERDCHADKKESANVSAANASNLVDEQKT
jgi:hypothetical protein